jgi:ubiquinone/menaquinone biosynthesis C-methylase UbiE
MLRDDVDCVDLRGRPKAGMRGMDDFFPGTLKVWDDWSPATLPREREHPPMSNLTGPHYPAEFARRLYAQEAFHSSWARSDADEKAPPYSLQWFLEIESKRHERHGKWIPRLLEFAKHSGEKLLGLGDGLGTDWIQYARHGADVVICCPHAEQLGLIQRNFELRGLSGRFLHVSPTCLPIPNATIDVVCVSGLLDRATEPRALVEEIYRVLKPGGKVLAVAPAYYEVEFWSRLCMPWQQWLPMSRKSIDAAPGGYSRRRLKLLFRQFTDHRVHKRQLRRSEVPHVWRVVPLQILERLMGRLLVLKAFKPLSAAIGLQLAA